MTADQLAVVVAFAKGPLDGYMIHDAQLAVRMLLEEHAAVQRLNDGLCERIAAQSECLTSVAERSRRMAKLIGDEPALTDDVEEARERLAYDVEGRIFDSLLLSPDGQAELLSRTVRPFGEALKQETLAEKMQALRDAGGSDWDGIDDPARYLKEVTGG